jgi:hypothetical protein
VPVFSLAFLWFLSKKWLSSGFVCSQLLSVLRPSLNLGLVGTLWFPLYSTRLCSCACLSITFLIWPPTPMCDSGI